MPTRVFSVKERDELRIKMFRAGFALIKQHGMTHASVAKITKEAGLGTSTFYNFFDSKEQFVLELIEYQRDRARQFFNDALAGRERLPVDDAKKYLKIIIFSSDSIYKYLTPEDEQKLMNSAGGKETFSPNKSSEVETMSALLSHMEGIRQDADWKVIANLLKIMAIAQAHRSDLHEDALAPTLDAMYELLFSLLFEIKPPAELVECNA